MPTVAELAQQELDKRRVQQVSAFQSSYNPFNPNFRATVGSKLRELIDDSGIGGGYKQGLINAGNTIEAGIDFTPIVGDAVGVGDIRTSYNQGDMLGTGINTVAAAVGALPIIGDVAAKGAKSALRRLNITEDEYIQAINPQGTRIAPEARPNLGMGDMYGMAPRNASEIMTQELPSGEVIRYVQGDDGVYALGYNPDLGEEDVVGYMLGGGDGSELAVVDQMQGQGIGGNLSYLYRSQNPMAQSGGFTEAGEAAARKTYRRINEADRMQRAQDLGFDTGRTAYRGIGGQYDPEKSGYYQMFTSSPQDAKEYGENVISAYTRRGNNLSLDAGKRNFNDIPVNILPENVRKNLHYTLNEPNSVVRTDDIAHAAREAGYDSVTINNVFDKASNEIPVKPSPVSNASMSQEMMDLLDEVDASGILNNTPDVALPPEIPRDYEPATIDIIFDPKNIRSIEAEFDPAKADSADLLSSFGTTSALRGIV